MPQGEMATWAMTHLVNRTDCYGSYYKSAGKTQQSTRKKGLPHWVPLPVALERHFAATSTNDIIGLHSTSQDNTSKWLGIDIDAHTPQADQTANLRFAIQVSGKLEDLGFSSQIWDSNGIGGIHIWCIFGSPVPTHKLFALGNLVTRDWQNLCAEEPEIFPKQPSIRPGGFGNWLRLPGRHHTRDHCSRLWLGDCWQ